VGSNPTPRTLDEPKSVLANYINFLLSKKAIKQSTIKRKVRAIKSLLKRGINLCDADSVVKFLNESEMTNGSKDITVNAYKDYLRMIGLGNIKLPEFRVEDKLPFIPIETELDAITNSVRMKMSTFLRILKETACRPIEAWKLKWLDLDLTNRCLTFTPAKYSNARKMKISERTLHMTLSLPRKTAYIFSLNGRFDEELSHFARNYQKTRNRLANKLQNPRLRQISLRTFRHWKATMLYYQTKDILYVKEFLGHKSIKNTLKYVHLANALSNQEDAYICKVAKTVEDATQLIEQCFDYVTEIEGIRLFRKRK